jgi:hypothetical protein
MAAVLIPQMKTAPFFLVNIALSIFNSVPWVAIFMILQFFGIKLYVVRERDVCKRIQKRLYMTSHSIEGQKSGFAIGLWYIGHVVVSDSLNEAWFITIMSSYEMLTKETNAVDENKSLTLTKYDEPLIEVYERLGSFQSIWFKKRHFTNRMKPQLEQSLVLEKLVDSFYSKSRLVAFLHGPPGTGKSILGIMLASTLGGSYCNTLRPWQPGDSLGSIYSEIEPTSSKPLVVAFDEVDTALIAIHKGIPDHKSMPISVQNKTGWNRMLDEIGRGLYPHLILLLTSNSGPELLEGLDPSYIRKGRVDIIIEFSKKIVL